MLGGSKGRAGQGREGIIDKALLYHLLLLLLLLLLLFSRQNARWGTPVEDSKRIKKNKVEERI